jgi:hypothetical protein
MTWWSRSKHMAICSRAWHSADCLIFSMDVTESLLLSINFLYKDNGVSLLIPTISRMFKFLFVIA